MNITEILVQEGEMEGASKEWRIGIQLSTWSLGHYRGVAQSSALILTDFFPTSMTDKSRSPSIQSFTSADSVSMLASPTPESPATPSTASHEDDVPRGTTPELREEPVVETAHQSHRFYLKDGNIKFRVSSLITKGSRVASLNCNLA